jgi:hypothetical protein
VVGPEIKPKERCSKEALPIKVSIVLPLNRAVFLTLHSAWATAATQAVPLGF